MPFWEERKVKLSKHKKKIKMIIISILLIYVGKLLFLFISMFFVRSSSHGISSNINSQDTHPEVIEWMAECDASGKGVFVLKLSRERVDQFFFASARPEGQELPNDVFGAFIYINSFENDDIEHLLVRAELVNSTFSVFYQTKGTHEHLEDVLYDFYYESHFWQNYDHGFDDLDEFLYSRYFGRNINYFSGYELSSIRAQNTEVAKLEIFINGEKVDFHVSLLE